MCPPQDSQEPPTSCPQNTGLKWGIRSWRSLKTPTRDARNFASPDLRQQWCAPRDLQDNTADLWSTDYSCKSVMTATLGRSVFHCGKASITTCLYLVQCWSLDSRLSFSPSPYQWTYHKVTRPGWRRTFFYVLTRLVLIFIHPATRSLHLKMTIVKSVKLVMAINARHNTFARNFTPNREHFTK